MRISEYLRLKHITGQPIALFILAAILAGCGGASTVSRNTSPPNKAGSEDGESYVVLQREGVRAVIVNNDPVNDSVLTGHQRGYSGVASLTRSDRPNPFVPLYSGLNFEHILDGTKRSMDALFEPRRASMDIHRDGENAAVLHQPPTQNWGLESWIRYALVEDGAIEMTYECIPRAWSFRNKYVGVFFANYMHQPDSPDITFPGWKDDALGRDPQWIRGISPEHGKLATHRALRDSVEYRHDPEFPLPLVFNYSRYRYSEPWYYGMSHGMAFVLIFREQDQVRFSQSPSGGGDGNPAWDFQWFIRKYEVGKRYGFIMRVVYVPFESQEQISKIVAKHRLLLSRK